MYGANDNDLFLSESAVEVLHGYRDTDNWLTVFSEQFCKVVIDGSFEYIQLDPFMRTTLIGIEDMKTYVDVLMRLREPMEERIRAN